MNSFHTSPDLFLNSNNPHPLIEPENTYHLSRKLLTVHANDRDTMYYKNSNEFSIKCPQAYTNVQSMRLNEISFPNSIFNFSEKLNNKTFNISFTNTPDDMNLVSIPDGYYTPDNLATTMKYAINNIDGFTDFEVNYNANQCKFIIYHLSNSFYISHADNTCHNNNFTYNYKEPLDKNSLPIKTHLLNTGFLYTIGFDLPNSSQSILKSTETIINDLILSEDITPNSQNACISSSNIRFRNRQPIYLEIDRYNLYDELNPYPKGSSNLYNNFSNSSTNTAFIKLPAPLNGSNSQDYSKNLDHLNNVIVFFDPPLQRLQNLSFKFRYHDGYLVDLNNQDVNFTLEINQLRNEIPRQLNIRTPAL